VGGTITIAVTITTPGCPSFSAVQSGTASFGVGTNLIVGSFGGALGNVFTAGPGAANRQFPIYARFTNPCTGLTYTDTIPVIIGPAAGTCTPGQGPGRWSRDRASPGR